MEIDEDPAKSRQRLVVLVDGDEQSRLVCRTTLSEAGFEVITATDFATALLVAGLTLPDVILVDIDVPACSSVVLSRDIRAHRHPRGAQLIAITSQPTPHEHVEDDAGRFDQILVRPAEPQRILELVGEALVSA